MEKLEASERHERRRYIWTSKDGSDGKKGIGKRKRIWSGWMPLGPDHRLIKPEGMGLLVVSTVSVVKKQRSDKGVKRGPYGSSKATSFSANAHGLVDYSQPEVAGQPLAAARQPRKRCVSQRQRAVSTDVKRALQPALLQLSDGPRKQQAP